MAAVNWWMEGFQCAQRRPKGADNVNEVFNAHYTMIYSMVYSSAGVSEAQAMRNINAKKQFEEGWKAAMERK